MAEYYMMAQKVKLFVKIVRATHPNEVKKLERQVKNYNESVW